MKPFVLYTLTFITEAQLHNAVSADHFNSCKCPSHALRAAYNLATSKTDCHGHVSSTLLDTFMCCVPPCHV